MSDDTDFPNSSSEVSSSRRGSWPPSRASLSHLIPFQGFPKVSAIQEELVSNVSDDSAMTVMSQRRRKVASMFQHYYPEGGWGIVIILVVTIIQILVHGLILAFGVLLPKVIRRFRVSPTQTGSVAVI